MLDRIKGLGGQISNMATSAVDGVTSTVKDGASAVADKATSAAQSASRMAGDITNKVNDVATREAIAQMRDVLAIAAEELARRPIVDGPVTLTCKVDVMVAALEVQMVFDPKTTRVIAQPPGTAAANTPALPAAGATKGQAPQT